nr:UvrD-helicase domain-containing protein [Nannocystis pusilla]
MRILASAGSGKTYQLTNRYLQILSRGAFPYSILASTFTRAAAGEIRDRILRTLAEAADDAAKRDELGHRLHRDLARTRVLDLLASLANNLHRLQIRTLDSFFGTIVRCFSLELGLPTDARIVDEDEAFRLRREAIGLMLEEGDTEAIIELLASLTEGSSERAVTDTIDNTVSSLYDLYREAQDTSAWEAIAPEPTLGEQELDDAIAALRFAVPTDLGKRGIEAHTKDCQRAEQCRTGSSDDWMEFFTTGLAKKVAENELVYYNKPIAPGTVFAYRRLLSHARGVFRRRVIEQTRATCTLLQLFDSCYRRVKREHKVLTFADLTVALAQADLAGHLDEICFRIDARLRHVLLDEMQDTSIQQWNALRPIVDETVSYSTDERSFFCVGDVKQSIYGWRNACPEILSRLDDLLHRPGGQVLHKETLATSFRSSPAVIEVVNKIFTNLKDNPTLLRYPYAARRWDSEFEQHTTTRKIAGYVQVRAVGRCEDQGKRQALRLQEAAALVAELYHRHPGKTIGVLLRTNGAVGRVLYELGPTRLKIPATGRGGGPLTDAPAVNAILDLLRLADHPDHSIAGFNVFASPLGQVVGFDKDDRNLQRRVAARVRRQIASDGLAPTLQQWVRAIAGQVDERQYRRCMQLIQLAQVWDERRTLRCDQFVAMVETRPVADPAASAVQVMTVHQSKGLEFDIVILPELEIELASTRTLKVVYERDGDAGPVVRIARHVSKDMWQQFDDLRPIFEQHIDRLAHESLCLLYVAVTRARGPVHVGRPAERGQPRRAGEGFGAADPRAPRGAGRARQRAVRVRRPQLAGAARLRRARRVRPVGPAPRVVAPAGGRAPGRRRDRERADEPQLPALAGPAGARRRDGAGPGPHGGRPHAPGRHAAVAVGRGHAGAVRRDRLVRGVQPQHPAARGDRPRRHAGPRRDVGARAGAGVPARARGPQPARRAEPRRARPGRLARGAADPVRPPRRQRRPPDRRDRPPRARARPEPRPRPRPRRARRDRSRGTCAKGHRLRPLPRQHREAVRGRGAGQGLPRRGVRLARRRSRAGRPREEAGRGRPAVPRRRRRARGVRSEARRPS